MKKITSLIFVLVIVCSGFCINVSAVDTSNRIDNINDIPRDWTDYYEGLGERYGVKRSMDMHILNIDINRHHSRTVIKT